MKEMNSLENLSVKDLEILQKQIEAKIQTIKGSNPNLRFQEGIQKAIDQYNLPGCYVTFLESIKEKEPQEILDAIMRNEELIKFPLLIVLSLVFPCSQVLLYKALIELFGNYILNNGPNTDIGSLLNFPIDRMLKFCDHNDSMATVRLLDEQIFNFSRLKSKDEPTSVKTWKSQVLAGLQFITYIIEKSHSSIIFRMAMNFVIGKYVDPSIYSFLSKNDNKEFLKLLEFADETGADILFCKAILPAFKI